MTTSSVPRESEFTYAGALTLERFLYVTICSLALALRLFAISAAPLSPEESGQAIAAFNLYRGNPEAAESVGAVSPGLLVLQSLAFALFGANDAWARLPVVIASALFPLAFWWLRPATGRVTALLAAFLLAISPLWTFMGSQGLGDGLAVTALLFAVAFAVQAQTRQNPFWASVSGAALGLGLASGPAAWGAVILGAFTLLVVGGKSWQQPFFLCHWRRFAASLLVVLLVSATAAGLYPQGLQSVADLPAHWLATFVQRQPGSFLTQSLLFLTYETLVLFLGLVALILLPPEGNTFPRHFGAALYFWGSVAFLLALICGQPRDGILLALPALAILAARAISLMIGWIAAVDWPDAVEGVVATVALLGYSYVSFSGLARSGELAYLVLSITAVGIAIALAALAWMRWGRRETLGLLSALALLVLIPWSLSNSLQGIGLRRYTAPDLLHPQTTGRGVLDLARDVERLSWSRASGQALLPMVVEQDVGFLVGWYLRDQRYLNWTEKAPPDSATEVIITAGSEPLTQESGYVGQDYIVSRHWTPHFASATDFLRWLLYREGSGSNEKRVTLWVRGAVPDGS